VTRCHVFGYLAAICVHIDTQSGCFRGDEALFALQSRVECRAAEVEQVRRLTCPLLRKGHRSYWPASWQASRLGHRPFLFWLLDSIVVDRGFLANKLAKGWGWFERNTFNLS
jgi:hypothetical protein